MTALDPVPAEHFSVAVEPRRHEVVVAPSGPLDLSSADTLDREVRELQQAGFAEVVLDLRGLSFLDSSGLQVLLAARNTARRTGSRLTLVAGPPQVQRVFALTATRSIFDWR